MHHAQANTSMDSWVRDRVTSTVELSVAFVVQAVMVAMYNPNAMYNR